MEIEEEFTESVEGPIGQTYVTESGVVIAVYYGEHIPPEGGIPVEPLPEFGDQLWLFPGWGPSPSQLKLVEDAWRESELVVIANQLLSLEEAEAAAEEGEPPPADLLPGTRNQWLSFRTKVRAWKTGALHFPYMAFRPTRPA